MAKSFIQISDCHIDEENMVMGVNSSANLDIVINDIKTKEFDSLIISGDLAHNGTIKSYQKIQKKISNIKNNTYIIPGNHDDKDNLSKVFNSELKNNITLDNWQIITIDSTQLGKVSGFLDANTINFIYNSIKNSNAKYIIICLHHPIVPMNSSWDDSLSLENPDVLFNLIDKHSKIKAIIWGHAHQSETFNYKKTKLFSCPSTALQFYGKGNIGYNHYILHKNGDIDCHTKWL